MLRLFKKKKHKDTDVKDFYVSAGSIVYHRQLVEHNLRYIIYLDVKLEQQSRSLNKNEQSATSLLNQLRKENINVVFEKLIIFNIFCRDDVQYVKSLIGKIDDVTSYYFQDSLDERKVENPQEFKRMVRELQELESDIITIHKENMRIIEEYKTKLDLSAKPA
ncbi:MAG: hypothetical protein LBU60_01865 [Clostridiales bacterium]|jgi:hypothetical protein|nr:hypothetical protein [Clostridiales bacterium]